MKHLFCAVLAGSVVAGCSSGGSESGGAVDPVRRLGMIVTADDDSSQEVMALAVFMQADARQLSDFLDEGLTLDVCEVDEPGTTVEEDAVFQQAGVTTLSAGEGVVLSADSGTYAYMQRLVDGDLTAYLSGTALVYPSPDNLSFTAAGDDFGAFEVSLERPEAVTMLSHQRGAVIGLADTLLWEAAANSQAEVTLEFTATASNVTFGVSCGARDDGSFTLPESMAQELAALGAGGELVLSSVSRTMYDIVTNATGDTILLLRGVID